MRKLAKVISRRPAAWDIASDHERILRELSLLNPSEYECLMHGRPLARLGSRFMAVGTGSPRPEAL